MDDFREKKGGGGRGRGDGTPTWVKALGAISNMIRPAGSMRKGGKVRDKKPMRKKSRSCGR